MLCELRIENLALIESLQLNFQDAASLVVMTGETGAGKSIMLRAIKLLTGSRASTDWIRNGADSCVVEALFEISIRHKSLIQFLDDSGFGDDTTVIIKRIINTKGRSRMYVNGSLATAKVVAELTANMLNVASQHDQQQLLQPSLHLDFVDTMGDLWDKRVLFTQKFTLWKERLGELQELRKAEQDKEQKRDFLNFQVDEIRQAQLAPGEDEKLAVEKKKLKSADALVKLSQESFYLLSSTLVDELANLRRNMVNLAQIDSDVEALAEELSEYSYQAEDYAQQLREYRDSLEVNPLRLDEVNERLDSLQTLKRKYGGTIEDILGFADKAEEQLKQIDNMEQRITAVEIEVNAIENNLLQQATQLSKKRKATAAQLEKGMAQEMTSLAFNQAGIEVRWQEQDGKLDELRNIGWDRLEFFFSANPGEPARQLAKVASGGELSRLMLAMKCILAKKDLVETVIFDEVDAGIGGEAAEAVARKIQELATHHQVVCITHLPQIAARGTEHFLVAKAVDEGRTQSSITPLINDQRVAEIARMLAGESVTEQTQAWAKELLQKGSLQ